MAEKIVGFIYGAIFICPLIISMFFLLKSLFGRKSEKANGKFFESPFKSKILSKITLRTLSIIGLIVATFLVFNIAIRFWFPSIELPFPWNVVGTVLFFLYFGAFGILYGLGEAGHGGVSPSSVLKGLHSMVFKSESTNENLKEHNKASEPDEKKLGDFR